MLISLAQHILPCFLCKKQMMHFYRNGDKMAIHGIL